MTKYYERDGIQYCQHCNIEKQNHRYNCVRALFDKDLREGNLYKGFSCMYCGQELEYVKSEVFLCRNKKCTHYSFRKALYNIQEARE